MKIIMIFDQIQSGLGTKDDTMVPLTGKKEPVGPAVMMQPFLKEVDGHVVACQICAAETAHIWLIRMRSAESSALW